MNAYRSVLRVPGARWALLVGMLIRIPMFAGTVIMTLHVVTTLQHTYAAAGAVVAAATIATAISGPWRGRLLDRVGLRRTVLPSLVVLAVCWSAAPWLGYLPLLVLAAAAGLFVIPTYSIVRQWLIAVTDEQDRKTVMVLDSVATELAFMIGPAVGVVLATTVDTRWSLMIAELLVVAGGLLLFILNPSMQSPTELDTDTTAVPVRAWLRPIVVAVLAAGAASTVVLSGTDVAVIAALREMGRPEVIGLLLTLWGAGSAIGGLAYGSVRRSVPVFGLLLMLAVTTGLLALTRTPWSFGICLIIAGLFCAPTLSATSDSLSRAVPARVRGEAMGWHGSALTGGSAIGAPLAGVAIDHAGWQGGFIATAALGAAVALLGLLITAVRRRHRSQGASDPVPGR
ncbi:MFS transporter [Propionibacteriaceae bacterium Y1685]|uniref:MFS transporter n=1 Tax=Microlunatus sp. Y1700 TaxID=3418487 RepID=UPI003B789ABB